MKVTNYLLGYENLKIIQDNEMFNFSLDSVLLANFVTINKKAKKILDIGCGNAPIPLILSQKTNAQITGIEIQKEVSQMAEESVKLNNKEKQIIIINDDIKEYKKKTQNESYDTITCNPPYFEIKEKSKLNKNDYKTTARHEINLTLEDLLKCARKLLKNGGNLAIVHRPERLIDILLAMRKYNIEPKKIRLIYPKKDKEANILLIEGKKNGNKGIKILPPLYTHNNDGSYTNEIKKYFKWDDIMKQKSYDGTPILYIVPTPIGNMEDITIRALNILKTVDVIFAEDTRTTNQLLKHFDIKQKLISSHLYNEDKNEDKELEYLKQGKNIAIVSDRGTPVISDPGFILVNNAIKNGYNVVCLPGATALIPALVMSGLSGGPFTFYGFLNSKETKRKKELEALKNITHPIAFYEAPHRLLKTLKNIKEIFGNRQVAIVREISKKYEEVIRDNIENILQEIENIKGEIVIIVEGNKQQKNFDNLSVKEHVDLYIEDGLNSKEAIKKVAKERGIPKSEIYAIYHKI